MPKIKRAQRLISVSGLCSKLCRACLVVWVGFYPVGLVLIIVDSCLLGGISAVKEYQWASTQIGQEHDDERVRVVAKVEPRR